MKRRNKNKKKGLFFSFKQEKENNCIVAWNNKSAIFSHLMHYYIKRELTVIQKGTRPPYSLSYLQVPFHWLLFIYIIFSSYNKLNLMMECMYYNCSCSISHFKQMEWERINLPPMICLFLYCLYPVALNFCFLVVKWEKKE